MNLSSAPYLRPLRRLLLPYLSQEPAARLIRQTARQQWRLLSINLLSNLTQAFCEASTLGVVFLSVEVLSAPSTGFDWSSTPVEGWTAAVEFLNGLPSTALFITLLVIAVLLKALQVFSEYITNVSISYFGARCRALITADIHTQVLALDFPCVSQYKVGDLTDYAREGPEALRIQIEVSSNLILGLLLSSTYLIVLVRLSSWLLLAVILLGIFIALLQAYLLPRIRSGSFDLTQSIVDISTRITEDFQGMRLLHTSGQLSAADLRLRSNMSMLERRLREQARRLAVIGPFAGFLPILALAIIAALSLIFFGGTGPSLPSLVTFVLALQRLTQRLSMIATTFNQLADNSGRLARLNEILSPSGKQFRRQGGITFSKLCRNICFDRVSLQYGPEQPPSLIDISFSLPKGSMLALVGPSGAGKSSIADLFTGLYTPTSGSILIDDIPLNLLDISSWQSRCCKSGHFFVQCINC